MWSGGGAEERAGFRLFHIAVGTGMWGDGAGQAHCEQQRKVAERLAWGGFLQHGKRPLSE